MSDIEKVLIFWFQETKPHQWFAVEPGFDQVIQTRFGSLHQQLAAGGNHQWRTTPHGRLAEILVLDQFSRNLYRGTGQAFACDALALRLAQEAVALGVDKTFIASEKAFLYMPYMHSEDREVHQEAVRLFSQPGLEFNLQFELKHKAIIDRFGRYPHRNSLLARVSTPAEIEFLKGPDSSF